MKRGIGLLAAGLISVTTGVALADIVAPEAVRFEDAMVATSLTGAPGDAKNGAKIFRNRKLGNCLACHANSDQLNELFHGDVGPSLDGAGDRWTAEELRAIIINSKQVFGDETVMPGFYTMDVGENVAEKFVGKTILSAQEVEDVVAYLTTLK